MLEIIIRSLLFVIILTLYLKMIIFSSLIDYTHSKIDFLGLICSFILGILAFIKGYQLYKIIITY